MRHELTLSTRSMATVFPTTRPKRKNFANDIDAVPYESGFDKWQRQAVPS